RSLQTERLRYRRSVLRSPAIRRSWASSRSKRWAGAGAGADLHRERGHGPGFHQRGADRVTHEVVHHTLLAKTYFGLRGMHIDVDFTAGQVYKHQHRGVDRSRQNIAVGLGDGVLDQAVADETSVDENVDGVAIEFLDFGLGDEAVNRESPERRGDFFLAVFLSCVLAA